MAKETNVVELKLKQETAVWLRDLLKNRVQFQGTPQNLRSILACVDEIAEQLPGGDGEQA